MRATLPALTLFTLAAAATAQDNPASLATSAGCGGCHQAEKRMMGPSWQAIADRYQDQDDAAATLRDRMRAGSQGVWGEAPMPPVTPDQLTDDQLAAVVDWILNQ